MLGALCDTPSFTRTLASGPQETPAAQPLNAIGSLPFLAWVFLVHGARQAVQPGSSREHFARIVYRNAPSITGACPLAFVGHLTALMALRGPAAITRLFTFWISPSRINPEGPPFGIISTAHGIAADHFHPMNTGTIYPDTAVKGKAHIHRHPLKNSGATMSRCGMSSRARTANVYGISWWPRPSLPAHGLGIDGGCVLRALSLGVTIRRVQRQPTTKTFVGVWVGVGCAGGGGGSGRGGGGWGCGGWARWGMNRRGGWRGRGGRAMCGEDGMWGGGGGGRREVRGCGGGAGAGRRAGGCPCLGWGGVGGVGRSVQSRVCRRCSTAVVWRQGLVPVLVARE